MHPPPKTAAEVAAIFNQVAPDYDKINHVLSFGRHRAIQRRCLTGITLPPQAQVLDICTGTGTVAKRLHQVFPDAQITGIDFAEAMLVRARQKCPDLTFMQADAAQLPFDNAQFDLCTVSFGLRNTENLSQVLQEVARVLKPNGVFVNIDLGKPHWLLNWLARPLLYVWVSLVGQLLHGDKVPYHHLAASNEHFPSQQKLCEMVEALGFTHCCQRNYFFGQIACQRFVKNDKPLSL